MGWFQILPVGYKSSQPFQFNMMHILPSSKIPFAKVPLDMMISTKLTFLKIPMAVIIVITVEVSALMMKKRMMIHQSLMRKVAKI